MAKQNARGEPRLSFSRRAQLTFGGATSAGLVQDVSMKGFLIMSTRQFNVGDILDLRVELEPNQPVECKVKVSRLTSDDCIGTEIVEISEAGRRSCQQFIEAHYADRLRFGS